MIGNLILLALIAGAAVCWGLAIRKSYGCYLLWRRRAKAFLFCALAWAIVGAAIYLGQLCSIEEYRAVYARVMQVRSRGETWADAGLVRDIVEQDKWVVGYEWANRWLYGWAIPDVDLPRIGGL